MENELQYLNDEGIKYLIAKHEKDIETLKKVVEILRDELNRRSLQKIVHQLRISFLGERIK